MSLSDYSARMLVNLYRAAIVQVFNGYLEEFQSITEKMIKRGVADETEIQKFSAAVAQPIYETITQEFNSHISEIRVSG